MDKHKTVKLYEVLEKSEFFKSKKELDTYLHALIDIKEACDKIYNEYVANIINGDATIDEIQNNIWDIREEFRHIIYHITDAKLDQ